MNTSKYNPISENIKQCGIELPQEVKDLKYNTTGFSIYGSKRKCLTTDLPSRKK